MSKDMSYKGFTGSCEISTADDCLHGKILFIEDILTYEGQTVAELKAAFHDAVDEYLAQCHEEGVEPNKPFSGTFNVRLGPMLHRAAAISARRQNTTLNDFVTRAVKSACDSKAAPQVQHLKQG